MLQRLNAMLFERPGGLAWKLTDKAAVRSRQVKFRLFMDTLRPGPQDSVLDVGVSNGTGRAENFLELWYPYRERISALGVGSERDYAEFMREFPQVRMLFGDGRGLSFPDDSFDIVFSNAVVEHVGSREEQAKFVRELVRVGKRAFITTPNYWFPADSHTLIPFAHFLPRRARFWLYRKLDKGYWADINHLNMLTPGEFRSLFPEGVRLRIIRRRKLGLCHLLVAVVEKEGPARTGRFVDKEKAG